MKVSIYIATSLDGFIAAKDGGMDWLSGSTIDPTTISESEDYGYQAFMDTIDVLIMGRITYEFVLSTGFWPYSDKRVIILSNTLKKISETLPESVELKSGPPDEIYSELKNAGAKHLYIDGGKTIQSFLDAELIDEMCITRVPVLLGDGIPLFGEIRSKMNVHHVKTQSYPNGFVQSRYRLSH